MYRGELFRSVKVQIDQSRFVRGGERERFNIVPTVTRAGNYFPWRFAIVQARDEQICSSKVGNGGGVAFFPFSSTNKGEERGREISTHTRVETATRKLADSIPFISLFHSDQAFVPRFNLTFGVFVKVNKIFQPTFRFPTLYKVYFQCI